MSTAHRPAWTFDRLPRLEAALAHARELEYWLLRQACEVRPQSPAWNRYQDRLAVLRRRIARLAECGRVVRRNDRLNATATSA